MVRDGLHAASVLAQHFSNRTGGGWCPNPSWAICHRTGYRIFLAATVRAKLANEIAGNVKMALLALLLVWTFAAFGEEIAYRGYLLTRAADIGRRSTTAYWLGIVLVSILFGYGHYYKGPSGIIDSGIAGLILGVAYMLAGRNLWACVLTHGFIDTFGVIDAFFGWSK
jgi:membrane protease YdiL (CAAX protease family)